jgi:hypothetical protein
MTRSAKLARAGGRHRPERLAARIVINLAVSRAEGADFSAELLKLARLAGPKALTP